MKHMCLVNYRGEEEKRRLIEFLGKQGFEPGACYPVAGDHYGFIVDFGKKEYCSKSSAMISFWSAVGNVFGIATRGMMKKLYFVCFRDALQINIRG